MADKGKSEQFQLGFLTTIELADGGFVGGLLVTNRLGRPLEFQCTAPVRANRTQEILYGPTLVPHILTDLVGRTLVDKAGVKPDLVLTEEAEVLALREQISTPVAYLDSESASLESSDPDSESIPRLELGRQTLRFHREHSADTETIARKSHLIPGEANLSEPFDRVREALNEAAATNV